MDAASVTCEICSGLRPVQTSLDERGREVVDAQAAWFDTAGEAGRHAAPATLERWYSPRA